MALCLYTIGAGTDKKYWLRDGLTPNASHYHYQTIATSISVGDYAPYCHKLMPYSQVTLKSPVSIYLMRKVF